MLKLCDEVVPVMMMIARDDDVMMMIARGGRSKKGRTDRIPVARHGRSHRSNSARGVGCEELCTESLFFFIFLFIRLDYNTILTFSKFSKWSLLVIYSSCK